MVQFSTKFSWSIKLESKQIQEATKTISKVLRVAKETIRTRWRKLT